MALVCIKRLESYNVTVANSVVGSNGCNALQFGSETLGDFSDFLFENITITSAGKAGLVTINRLYSPPYSTHAGLPAPWWRMCSRMLDRILL